MRQFVSRQACPRSRAGGSGGHPPTPGPEERSLSVLELEVVLELAEVFPQRQVRKDVRSLSELELVFAPQR